MRKNSKRWLVGLLSVMMAAIFVPAISFAADDEGEGEDLSNIHFEVEDLAEEGLEEDEEIPFYADGDREVHITAYDDEGEPVEDWTPKLVIEDNVTYQELTSNCFTFSKGTLMLFGSEISKMDIVSDGIGEDVYIRVQDPESGEVIWDKPFCAPREEISWNSFESERYMLLNDYIYLDWVDCDVYNSEYPDGEEFEYPITKVTASPSGILEIKKDGSAWEIKGLKQGDATLTITYKDYKENQATHKCTIHVVRSYVELEMNLNGPDLLVPGQSTAVSADAYVESMDDIDDEQTIRYEWGAEGPAKEYIKFSPDTEDPSKVTVTVQQDLPDELIGTEFDVWVEATGKDGEGNDVTARAYLSDEYDYLEITSEIQKIVPEKIALCPGETKEITPQLMLYTREHPEGQAVEDVYFEFDYGDEGTESDISIEEKSDAEDTFILTRNSGAYVQLTCYAFDVYPDADEPVFIEEQDYYFNEQSFDLDSYVLYCPKYEERDFYVDDSNGETGEMDLPEILLVYYDEDEEICEIPKEFYTLKYQKVTGWKGDDPICEELSPGDKMGLDPQEEGYNGTAEYRIIAVPSEGSPLRRGEDDPDLWFYFYSKWSMASAYEDFYEWQYFVPTGEAGGYFRLPAGTKLTTVASDCNEKELTTGKEFSVSYVNKKTGQEQTSFPTKIGDYEIVLRGIAPYYGERISEYTLQIVPKGTSIAKLKKGKKSFTVKWKKQKSQTRGYEIQYSLKKNFKGKKTVKIKKNKITSKKIGKLKKKKTYYVRVRTFGKANGKTYYSAWSKVKKVKTK